MKLDLELLLAHADDRTPTLEAPLAARSALGMGNPDDPSPSGQMRHDGADPNAMPLQRWGVIAPAGPEGDRLLAAIDPLIRARQEAQRGRPVRIERVPARMSAEQARAWRSELARSTPVADQPRYLLFLGDLDRVSLELQQTLAIVTFAGRLAFPDEHGYEAYVDKVLRWERAPSAAGARALFCTVRDGTPATALGHAALMAPTRALCLEQQALGDFSAASMDEISASSRDALLDAAATVVPSVLLSMSHGLGAPRHGWPSAERQRALQGSMHLGSEPPLTADDLAAGPFLPGGVWFFLACFSAGTPARSVYVPWLRRLREAGMSRSPIEPVLASLPRKGDRPFIAALPQAALANPEGPLAVIGHVDLAWTYAFQDPGPGGVNHPARFYALLRSLCDGLRVGVAHAEITRFLIETSVDLSAFYDDEARAESWDDIASRDAAREIQKAHLWMRRHDLGGYVLLGDPAVRLPVTAR
ncbi:hypothetical protein [Sorangium sp. So ce542]|uniref:hypothetical protein n=1 Tax=Sorangium sp. So ce542 TaxID=3133316 RepID=UPI003F6029EE